MRNEIQQVREAMERDLQSAMICPDENLRELSPCGKYELEINAFATSQLPDYASLAVATVRRTGYSRQRTGTGDLIATVKRNDDRCFYAWVSRDGHDYLLFPEDLEGQSVVDLTTGRIEGFSSPDDRFIWAQFYPSADRTKLAIIGCYWACPYQVAVYDFQNPLTLPLPEIARYNLPANDAEFSQWLTAQSFSLVERSGQTQVCEF